MTFDPVTQAISRFIGLFDLMAEEGRLRNEHDKFKLKKQAEAEDIPLPGISPMLIIGETLKDYDPGLSYKPLAPLMKDQPNSPVYPYDPVQAPLIPASIVGDDVDVSVKVTGGSATVTIIIITEPPAPWFADGPGSVVSVTLQFVGLTDDDTLLDGLGTEFVSIPLLHAALDRIDASAEALKGFDLPEMPEMTGWMGFVKAVLTQFDAPDDGTAKIFDSGSVEVHVLRGDDVYTGVIVNGTTGQEAPELSDLLPAYLRPDEEASPDVVSSGAGAGGVSASDGETILRSSTGVGAKSETSSPSSHDFSRDFEGRGGPDDRPDGDLVVAGANSAINEIGIGSQWIDASVIVVRGDVAKVNAISQVNVLVEHDSIDGAPVIQQSAGYNIAEIFRTSSKPGDAPKVDSDVLPSGVQMFRIEADLYQINWIKQVTYVTDFDRAEVTFTAQMTFLGLGENEIVNSAILNEFGYRFDLMFVSGNMVDATIISQKNVLFDSDSVTTGTTNGSGTAGNISLADNLLYNMASINTTGIDSYAKMSDAFANAADDLAKGASKLADELTQDKLFAGQEMLRALQIDGDLVKINVFEQENIVGDADQLRLELQQMRDEFAAEVRLVAGSNALVNVAKVNEYGVDSTIMAGGTVYDDALIHQAEWFDNDAPADGVKMAGLTNDAVAAFLTEELAKIEGLSDSIVPTANHDSASSLDVMQSVLA